jgi:hypothetical protein
LDDVPLLIPIQPMDGQELVAIADEALPAVEEVIQNNQG